jgi:hypothetical protein
MQANAIAGSAMPGSATPWLPRSMVRVTREAGIGRQRGYRTVPKYIWGVSSPLRGRFFRREDLFRVWPSRQRRFIQGFLERLKRFLFYS